MPGYPVLHYVPELSQTHFHWFNEAIQPSHPLSPPSAFVFNLFQPQGLFHRVGFSHQMAKVLELKLQNQSFQWIFGVDSLQGWLVWSPCCPRDSQEASTVPKFKICVADIIPLLIFIITCMITDHFEILKGQLFLFIYLFILAMPCSLGHEQGLNLCPCSRNMDF